MAATAGSNLARSLEAAALALTQDPEAAAQMAASILTQTPGERRARLILGMALRRSGNLRAAHAALELLADEDAGSARTLIELGEVRLAMGNGPGAAEALRRAISLRPDSADAWRPLADACELTGDIAAADHARAELIRAYAQDSSLKGAAQALCSGDSAGAERLLRAHLTEWPHDATALWMAGEALIRLGRYGEAQALLDRCLEVSPQSDDARRAQVVALLGNGDAAAAVGHLQQLMARKPDDVGYRRLMAACLDLAGSQPSAG